MNTRLPEHNRFFTPVIPLFICLTILIPHTYSQESKKMWNKDESPEKEQAFSLLGEPLYRPSLSQDLLSSLTARYNVALENFRKNPGNPDSHIWLGRRLAYLGDYNKAIRVFTDGIYFFPNDARFYRHRGHRYITTRKLDLALSDFEIASKMIEGKRDKIEPDGAPNAAGIPVSTLHSNIWYHLGLTQYLLGDNESAFKSFERCYNESDNNDKKVSSGYWLYIIAKRLGREKFCNELLGKFDKEMELLENFAYHDMIMFYKSGLSPEEYGLAVDEIMKDPTRAYGLGIWYYLTGSDNKEKTFEIFKEIMLLPSWPSFGYIAAEAELARLK